MENGLTTVSVGIFQTVSHSYRTPILHISTRVLND